MKHRVAGRKLGRTSEHRLALLRNLATSLFERERITTTLPKAKELRRFAEKLLTLSKRETLHARRRVLRHVRRRDVVAKLFDTLSARYATRPGGYTRVIRLGPRRGDNAEMAIIELVGAETGAPAAPEKKGKAGKAAPGAPRPEKAAAKPAGRGAKAPAAGVDRAGRKAQPKGEPGAPTGGRKSKADAAPAARRKSTRSKREGG